MNYNDDDASSLSCASSSSDSSAEHVRSEKGGEEPRKLGTRITSFGDTDTQHGAIVPFGYNEVVWFFMGFLNNVSWIIGTTSAGVLGGVSCESNRVCRYSLYKRAASRKCHTV